MKVYIDIDNEYYPFCSFHIGLNEHLATEVPDEVVEKWVRVMEEFEEIQNEIKVWKEKSQ